MSRIDLNIMKNLPPEYSLEGGERKIISKHFIDSSLSVNII